MSFQAEITKLLNKLQDTCDKKNPDREAKNAPHALTIANAYFWTAVEKFAKGKKEEAWENMEKAGFLPDDVRAYDPGEYVLGEAPSFIVKAKVSEPVKRFNDETLADMLYTSKYKVPKPIAKEMIAKAKVPSASTVTKSIIER